MKKLDPAHITSGKMRLSVALGLLVAANLAALALNLSQHGLGSTERLLLSRTALIVVASLGVLRGSQPIMRILQVLLLIGAAGSAYLLTEGKAGAAEYAILLPDIILGLAVAALLQFDPRVAVFLRYQRSQHFGERVAVEARAGQPVSKAGGKQKQPSDDWDAIDDLYEDEK